MEKAVIEKQAPRTVADGLENLVAQMGTSADKRSHNRYVNSKRLSSGAMVELSDMYRTNWVAAKVVDIVADDMCREWRTFVGDPDTKTKMEEAETVLGVRDAFRKAKKWARLYGTAFIVLSVDDSLEIDKPLDVDSIKLGSLRHLKVIDRTQITAVPDQHITDPMNEAYGLPEYYKFNEGATPVHASRLLRFDGTEIPYLELRRSNYFSDSVIDRIYDAISNFDTASQSAASMVYEANVDIVKVNGLMNMLSSEANETALRKRFSLAKQMKSFNNMMLLDTAESLETKTNTFAGLSQLIDTYETIIAGGCDVPSTRLFGSSAKGLNATGEGDNKNYYDSISAKQEADFRPQLAYLDNIIMKSLGLNDPDLTFTFDSLFQMSDSEVAEINLKRSATDNTYWNMGVVTESIIAADLKETYTGIDAEYLKELDMAEDDPELEVVEGDE